MEFKEFKTLMQQHVDHLFSANKVAFIADTDKDTLWETYLNSFPKGTNPIFRERTEHDCSCCRQFIKSFGNVVFIDEKELSIVTIWDFGTGDTTYQTVANKMAKYVRSQAVREVFVTKEKAFGTDKSREQLDDSSVRTWEHFYIPIPKEKRTSSSKTKGTIIGDYHSTKEVFQRSLEEISKEAIETVLDLISQNSLYKGTEWKCILNDFLKLHKEYHKLRTKKKKNLYSWIKSVDVGAVIGKIRNHSIGVLLTDITNEMDLNEAVKRYENIVAPTNYKRPKAIFTKKMIEDAQKKIKEMGLLDSLGRRFATIEDITVNNVLFADRDSVKEMNGDVFSKMKDEASSTINPKKFDKLQEISIEDFIHDVLPRATQLELFFENRHQSNLTSLIAPKNKDSETLFKWNNNFSWAYTGNITDSMKERVKSAGGNVDGILRFSIQWNEEDDNQNDFDAHCIEPNKNLIFFQNKGRKHPSSGMLDVDIVHPAGMLDVHPANKAAVENITWTDKNRMREGVYTFQVHNFTDRGGKNGFRAEIEFDGQVCSFDYRKHLAHNKKVTVAKVKFSEKNGFEIVESLDSSMSVKKVWNLNTGQFHPVSVCMFSPNYWDEQKGIGNKHYFFMLKNCISDEVPNGFFNEFLKQDLLKHKRVFEALGNKMQVEPSEDQLSGLGFSSTKRNSVVCKVEGHTSRMIKITF